MEFIKENSKNEEKIEVGDLVRTTGGELRIIVDLDLGRCVAINLNGFNNSGVPMELSELLMLTRYELVAKSKDLEIRIKK